MLKVESRKSSAGAFTLVEILVVMALLSVIVLGLMAMFTQTQRAFRAGLMQTDVQEAGRLATDMIARELEQITPSGYPRSFTNPPVTGTKYPVPNFVVDLITNSANRATQQLPSLSGPAQRTNVVEDLFFLTCDNLNWTGIGYFVRTNRTLGAGSGPVGTLYRFEETFPVAQFATNRGGLYNDYNFARASTNALPYVSKIMDGVVHFRIRPSDNAGWVIPSNPSWTNYYYYPPAYNSNNFPINLAWPTSPRLYLALGEPLYYEFYSNAVPAFVEFEIGVLEQQTFEHYKSIPAVAAQNNYLNNAAGRVHLFRQRVAVRNVDPLAYQ